LQNQIFVGVFSPTRQFVCLSQNERMFGFMFARSLLAALVAILGGTMTPATAQTVAPQAEARPLVETIPTWFIVRGDLLTSAPVIDPSSGATIGMLPPQVEILTFARNEDYVLMSFNRRSVLVPREAVEPKYPLPPERPQLVISPGGLERNIARDREIARERRAEGLAPRVMATPFGFVPEQTPGGQGAAGGGRAGGGRVGGEGI
jgi:hypothetical protein